MTINEVEQTSQNGLSGADGLPEGWISADLGEGLIVDVQPGFACGENNRDGRGIAHLRPMNVDDEGRIDLSTVKYVPVSKANQDKKLLHKGDVIFNNTNSPELVGKTAFYNLPEQKAFSNHMTRLRCQTEILDPQFCAMALHQKWREGYFRTVCSHHVSQSSIGRAVLLNTPIVVPPLPDQKRIVAKVEELLARVNVVRERLAKVKGILKRFRQSVLSAACSGRLTEDWRKLNPAKESGHALLQTILKEQNREIRKVLRSHPETSHPNNLDSSILPDPWIWTTVGQITKNFDGQRVPVKAEDREKRRGIYPYYGASGIIDSIDDYLFDGDFLLIAEDGANLLSRSTPIAFRASGKFWVNNHAHVVQTYVGVPLQYLECYLNGIDLQEYVTGSAQPKLTQASMNRIPIPLPPPAEQYEIVRRIEALFKLAEKIEKGVIEAEVKAEKLIQAILAKAFRGELVSTEAELARREGRSYEPVPVLLERIGKAREEARPRTKKTKKKEKGVRQMLEAKQIKKRRSIHV